MTTYKDISSKIDPNTVEVLSVIKDITDKLNIPFFIVGAKARDLFFTLLYDIQTTRATQDIDLGIKVDSWKNVTQLIEGLIATMQFKSVNKINSRLRHSNNTLIDIVPFGSVENPPGKVQWSTEDAIMTTLGFEEALCYSLSVNIRDNPPLEVKVCTPPAMVMLKLIAWHEKYPQRSNDAQDIVFILKNYIDAGNDTRLYKEDADLLVDGFDYESVSARLIGRDIVKIANLNTLEIVSEILEQETKTDSKFLLVTDMVKGRGSFEELFHLAYKLLNQLKIGILECKKL